MGRSLTLTIMLMVLCSGAALPARAQEYAVYPVGWADLVLPNQAVPLAEAKRLAQERRLEISAAPGEYEPATFVIVAGNRPLKDVVVTVDGRGLPATAFDLRVVKAWWQRQGAPVVYKPDIRNLEPELLLHDDGLITVNYARPGTQVLNFPDLPDDAATLQPFDVPARMCKQVWLTFHAPRNAKPGKYACTVTIKPVNAPATELPLIVRVRNFTLLSPANDYGMYFRGAPSVEVLKANLANLSAHGVTAPEGRAYSGLPWPESARKDVELLREMGMLPRRLSLCEQRPAGSPVWPPLQPLNPTEEELATCRAAARAYAELNKSESWYPVLHGYMSDERVGTEMIPARAMWRAFGEAGGRISAAVNTSWYGEIGSSLQLPIVQLMQADWSDPGWLANVRRAHRDGNPVWLYAFYTTTTTPLFHRYHQGLWLWGSPFDGTSPWVYQHLQTREAWEFDWLGQENVHWRYCGETYPGAHGPIDTLQWEAYREGIDDNRYLTTLAVQLLTAEDGGIEGAEVSSAGKYLRQVVPALVDNKRLRSRSPYQYPEVIDPDTLDTLRETLAGHIAALQEAHPQLAPEAILQRMMETEAVKKEPSDLRRLVALNILAERVRLWRYGDSDFGTYPYGVGWFPEKREQLHTMFEEKRYREGAFLAAEMCARLWDARTAGTITPVQWGALRDEMDLEMFECQSRFLRDDAARDTTFDTVYEWQAETATFTFRPDWESVGEEQGWFKPEFDHSGWGEIKNNWWETQDYDLLDGYGWYRMLFELTSEEAGRELWLQVGAADERATIWLNGRKVFDSPNWMTYWAHSFLVRLPAEAIEPGRNLLVIRVDDSLQAGGLWGTHRIVAHR